MAHRSTVSSLARRWSFFMRCLLERVRACDYRTRLAVAKLPFEQKTPTLPRPKVHSGVVSQVSRHLLALPWISRQSHVTGLASEYPLQISNLMSIQFRRPSATGSLMQTSETLFLESLHPVGHRSWSVSE